MLFSTFPIDLLNLLNGPEKGDCRSGQEAGGEKLVETLAAFRISACVRGMEIGHTVVRYELELEKGSAPSVQRLAQDIALFLGVRRVRVDPLPEGERVAVEVPRQVRGKVFFRELIGSAEFADSHAALPWALGAATDGQRVICDLAKMPHILMAGEREEMQTALFTLYLSLLSRFSPERAQFVLFDPEGTRFPFSDLPSLFVPKVTDGKRMVSILSWLVIEMEKRYEMLKEKGVREIGAYTNAAEGDAQCPSMPRLVVVIGELAELMEPYRDETEINLCRLAQKGRAVGIHLVLATNRPKGEVLTGLIRANIPARMAFYLEKPAESRRVLDTCGAETLMGKGDMLYFPLGARRPLRVQGATLSSEEVKRVLDFLRSRPLSTT